VRTRESILTLIAELEGDYGELGRITAQNARAWERIQNGAHDPIDWGALGFTLHSAYGLLENYFLRVSKFFENDLPPQIWHKALLEKMGLEIPGVRPAVLADQRLARQAKELLKFRHKFRNLYGEDLDPKKTTAVQEGAVEFFTAFSKCHADFLTRLRAIAEALG
jgi:hypothetical protein